MIIAQPKDVIARFVSDTIGGNGMPWGEYTALGLVRDDDLVAGVIYNHNSDAAICMHVGAVGKQWLNREFIFACFDYPFNQLGKQRVTGLVPKKNKAARRFDEHLGFKLEGCMRQGLIGDDLLVYGMLRGECRWIKPEFLEKVRRHHELAKAA